MSDSDHSLDILIRTLREGPPIEAVSQDTSKSTPELLAEFEQALAELHPVLRKHGLPVELADCIRLLGGYTDGEILSYQGATMKAIDSLRPAVRLLRAMMEAYGQKFSPSEREARSSFIDALEALCAQSVKVVGTARERLIAVTVLARSIKRRFS